MMIRTVAIFLALVSVAVAIGSDSTYENEFAGVPLPPSADEAFNGEDPKADALVKAAEAKDPVLDFMQDAMMKTGPFMPKDDKAALDVMDADLANQKMERARITKTISDKEKAEAHLNSAMDRFHALRSKYTNFAAAPAEEEDFDEVISEKKLAKKLLKKKNAAKPHTLRHTRPHKHFEAPPSYKAVPDGDAAKIADAKLARGADADKHENWKVHKETYRELHPEAFERKKKPVKKLKRKTPTPLKDAEREEHHAIETIHSTKKIIAKEPKRLTLKEAKKKCVENKHKAKQECHDGKAAKGLFCKERGTTQVQCSQRAMKVAADCKVAHESAYKNCLSLWKKARNIIADRKKRKAAPMKVSTKYVKEHTKMSTECSKLMAASAKKCKDGFASSKKKCKKKMDMALDAQEAEMSMALSLIQKGAKKAAVKKAGKKAKKSAKSAVKGAKKLRNAKAALAKAGASGAMSKAVQACAIAKNDAKRSCMTAIQDADDRCSGLLRGEIHLKAGKAKGKAKKGAKKGKKGAKKGAKKGKKKAVEELAEEPTDFGPTDEDMEDPTMP